MKRVYLLALQFFIIANAFTKELYMTVYRDFSPEDVPSVEIHYRADKPVTFKVLKPKNLKEFIASQIDLRRAWRQPKVSENPAFYLVHGLNKTKLDLDWIRIASSLEVRENVKGILGKSSTPIQSETTSLFKGNQKIVALPNDFELVNEVTLYPEKNDQKAVFDVPEFDEYFYDSGFKTKKVEFPKLKEGFYLVQTIQGDKEGQFVLVVNNISVEIQQTSDELTARVANRKGSPISKAKVSLKDLSGKWIGNESTDENGVARFSGVQSRELIAVVDDGKGTAIVDTNFFPAVAEYPDVYLYTDRPMYKTNDHVFFKGILRKRSSGLSKLWGGAQEVTLTVVDTKDSTVVEERTFPLTSYGTFSGDFEIKDFSADLYRIHAEISKTSHRGEFRVKNYVKPIFFMTVQSEIETLHAGSDLRASIIGKKYAGGVPTDVTFTAELFRVRSDGPEWIEDLGLGESGSKVTYGFDSAKAVSTHVPIPILKQDDVHLGPGGRAFLQMSIPAELPGDPNYDYKFLLKITAQDRDGNFASTSKSYLDQKSELTAQSKATAIMASADNPAQLKVRSVYPSGKAYPDASGVLEWWHTPYKGEPTATGKVEFKTNAQGKFDVPIPVDRVGYLEAKVTLLDRKGVASRTQTSILIVGKKEGEGIYHVQDMTLMARKTMFELGETSKTLLLLPESWGEGGKNKGQIYITIAGPKIFEQRVQEVSGLSTWIVQDLVEAYGSGVYILVSYPDPVRGWVQKRIYYRIVPQDKILTVDLQPKDLPAMAGTEQTLDIKVLDKSGKPVKTELSVSVVDRAALDLQPEIRPPLIDFFYPVDRLNVMTFLSSQFQSYGYAESLAGLLGQGEWYAAAKPTAKNMEEKDTALFTGHLETDSEGHATITFPLPGNQTIWKVIALAVDTSGRFGESQKEFQASLPLSYHLAAPPFLRAGDSVVARVQLTNQVGKTLPVHMSMDVDAALTQKEKVEFKQDIKSKEEKSLNRSLTMNDTQMDAATVTTKIPLDGKVLTFKNSIEKKTHFASTREFFRWGIGEEKAVQTLSVEPGESLETVSLQTISGLSGSLFSVLKWMHGYPYGCAEQIASKTATNYVLKSILSESYTTSDLKEIKKKRTAFGRVWHGFIQFWKSIGRWIWSKLTGRVYIALTSEDAELLTKSEEFVTAGFKRLAEVQNENGSFGWFEGQEDENATMTAIVLMTLLSMDDRDLASKIQLNPAYYSLMNIERDEHPSRQILISYIRSRMHALGITSTEWDNVESDMKFQMEYAAKDGHALDRAFIALAYDNYGQKNTGDAADFYKAVINKLSEDFDGMIAVKPQNDSHWSDIPGSHASTLAIVGHALHAAGKLKAKQKSQLSAKLITYFNGWHFGSTFETSQTLLHSQWLIREEIKRRTSGHKPKVLLSGKPIQPVVATATISGWDLKLPAPVFKPGKHDLAVEYKTDVEQALFKYTRKTPFDNVKAGGHGWSVARTYYRVNEAQKTKKVLDGDVNVGDLVYVELEFSLDAKQSAPSTEYYTMVDTLPAGFGYVEEDDVYTAKPYSFQVQTGQGVKRMFELDEVRWFTRRMPKKLGYVMRAYYAGDFSAGISKLENMYDDTITAWTTSRRFHIQPKR